MKRYAMNEYRRKQLALWKADRDCRRGKARDVAAEHERQQGALRAMEDRWAAQDAAVAEWACNVQWHSAYHIQEPNHDRA